MQSVEPRGLHSLMVGDVMPIHIANCVLAKLWRLFLYELNVKAPTWELLLTQYVKDCKENGVADDVANNLKGNIPKRLSEDAIQWTKFCQGLSVFNFEEVEFVVFLTEKGVTKEIGIRIPRIYSEDPGKILKVLWDRINVEYPEKAPCWKQLFTQYSERFSSTGTDIAAFSRSNTKRGLGKATLTWNTLYKGIVIYGFDTIRLELRTTRRKGCGQHVTRMTIL